MHGEPVTVSSEIHVDRSAVAARPTRAAARRLFVGSLDTIADLAHAFVRCHSHAQPHRRHERGHGPGCPSGGDPGRPRLAALVLAAAAAAAWNKLVPPSVVVLRRASLGALVLARQDARAAAEAPA